MLTVHHLSHSRSEKIVWLLEELQENYELKVYLRDPATLSAPPEMKALHPLGKSPLITDHGETFSETGAIIDYILKHYGKGRLQPAVTTVEHDRFVEWMHFSEGSGMFPILLKIFCTYAESDVGQMLSMADSQLIKYLDYIEQSLTGVDYLVGNTFSAADIHVSFVAQTAKKYTGMSAYENTLRWLDRLQARPAFKRAEQKAGYFGAAKPE